MARQIATVLLLVFTPFYCELRDSELCKGKVNDVSVLECKNHIPPNLPETVQSVVIESTQADIRISKQMFAAAGWSNISVLVISGGHFTREIIFETNCFVSLTELRELRIHVVPHFFSQGTYNGLEQLEVLDISNSTVVKQKDLISVILAENSLPAMEKLIMVSCGTTLRLDFDEEFWRLIEQRPISYIDLSQTQVRTFNVSAFFQYCKNVRTLIARGLYVGEYLGNSAQCNSACDIDVMDFSNAYLPGFLLCFASSWSNENSLVVDLNRYKAVSVLRDLSLDGVCPAVASSRINYFRNLRNVTFVPNFLWKLRKLTTIICSHISTFS